MLMDKKPNSIIHLISGLLAVLSLAVTTACSTQPEKPAELPPEPKQEQVLIPAPEPAPEPVVLRPDYPERYVVVKGDTLWDISARFLRDPWYWPELWQNNPQVENPHLIYPGDVLTMYFIDGKPVLHIDRGEPTEGARYPVVALSPRIREESLGKAIPTIPLDAIAQFLTRPRVVTKEELEKAPYIVATSDEHLIATVGANIYARRINPEEATEYAVIKPDRTFTSKAGEVLGYETVYLADATLLKEGDPATLRVTDATREVFQGNRLFPIDDRFMQNFQPHAPKDEVQGDIVAVVGGVSRVGQFQMVVVDMGRQEGMNPGTVLAIKQAGGVVRDVLTNEKVTLPDERAGIAMVFRVFERVSYALVMNATRSIKQWDKVTNP
jgi:hypothetical protein